MKILEKIEEHLSEGMNLSFATGYYSSLWKKKFIGKDLEPIFLDHRKDFSEEKKKMIQEEKKKYVLDMHQLEADVMKALVKMDKRSKEWSKFLKKQGL